VEFKFLHLTYILITISGEIQIVKVHAHFMQR